MIEAIDIRSARSLHLERGAPASVCERRGRYASIQSMAVRVGIDLVAVQAVREAMSEHGDHYLNRIYTEAEIRECRTPQGMVPERLAARFAAKEATIKVLRPTDEPIPWRNIEVIRHPSGWVELELSGCAATLAAEQSLGDFAVSVSHEGGFATAVVIARRT